MRSMRRSIGREAGVGARAGIVAAGWLCAAALAGCAAVSTGPSTGSSGDGSEASRAAPDEGPSTLAVAVDLVSVLVQLEGHSPYDTTVQVNPPAGGFGADLVRALEAAGYGLQLVGDDQGPNYLGWNVTAIEAETGRQDLVEIRLRDLSVGRRVTRRDGAWVPVSPVRIRGLDPQPVALDGSVYVHRPERALDYPSGVRFLDPDGEEALVETTYRYAYRPTGAAKTAGAVPTPDPMRFVSQATARLYEGGGTAFAQRPAADFIARQTFALRFPGASHTQLGDDNRRVVGRLVEFFEPARDRFSIVSCSPEGADTDASAARSGRVKAELLTLGVPGDQVLESGCTEPSRLAGTGRDLLVSLERLIGP